MASCLEELLGSERWDALSTALCISKVSGDYTLGIAEMGQLKPCLVCFFHQELCESDQLTPGFKSQLYTAIDSKLQVGRG